MWEDKGDETGWGDEVRVLSEAWGDERGMVGAF